MENPSSITPSPFGAGGSSNPSSRKRSNLYLQYRNTTLAEESVVKATITEATKATDEQAKILCRQFHATFGTPYPSTLPMEDLQLQTARKIRQMLQSTNQSPILQVIHEHDWLGTLLDWLNMHDRPAVQMESLLLLTRLAEVCAQATYGTTGGNNSLLPNGTNKNSSLFGPAGPLGLGPAAGDPSKDHTLADLHAHSAARGGYPYLPTPPLSFSSTLSKEALSAFDASISATVRQQDGGNNGKSGTSKFGSKGSNGVDGYSSSSAAISGPSPIAAAAAFLPPTNTSGGAGWCSSSSFPQHLSSNGQYLLLRHTDAIPTLISLLTTSKQRDVYEQAVWILGTIAAGDSGTNPGGSSGSGPSSGGGSGSNSGGGNNSSSSSSADRDKVSARDVILAAGVMTPLLRCMEAHPTNLSLQRIGSWTLSHLVEGIFQQTSSKGGKDGSGGPSSSSSLSKSNSDYSSSDEIEMETLLPVLSALLRMADPEVLSYTCWTLSHLCDGPSSHISAVVTTKKQRKSLTSSSSQPPPGGLVPRLVELLGHSSWRVTKPALRTIGNIVCAECSDESHTAGSPGADYTDIILECEAVPKLKELVTHPNREIQKEACWTLSNIAAGTVDQIQAVIDSGAIPPLVKLVSVKSTDQEVRSEACWVVLNATSCGSDAQIEVLVDEGCVSVLGVLLGEPSMVMMALEGLERVLQVEEAREQASSLTTPILVSAALIEKALDKHNSSAVHKRASRIWKQHFVSCALCHESFSKHRTADATFCEECKCYVCSSCDCKIYHLSYQEELWAESEQKDQTKKTAKKAKKAKKKEKAKQKKEAKAAAKEVSFAPGARNVSGSNNKQDSSANQSRSSTIGSDEASDEKGSNNGNNDDNNKTKGDAATNKETATNEDAPQETEESSNQIDYVLYLQQTGSIIALAKLMDALEGYENSDFDQNELARIRNNHGAILNQ